MYLPCCTLSDTCIIMYINFFPQQVFYGWRRVCIEFDKRLDPELPFYYYTSTHDRFYEGQLPSFDETPAKPRKQRVPRREQPGANVGQRVALVSRGSASTRATFHNYPVDLPPPPATGQQLVMMEHSYASGGPQ